MAMLDVERRQRMAAFIEQRQQATVAQLSAEFGVSEATARRDLAQLSKQGRIQRAHGGAVALRGRHEQGLPEPPVLERAALQVEEKRRIGKAAGEWVEDGDVVIIGGGTTTATMIPHLAGRRGVTIVTNALNIATSLTSFPNINVVILGGILRHPQLVMSGPPMEEVLEDLRADKLFMGATAIHVDYGLSVDDLPGAQSDRALMAAASQVIVLCDHTKFGRISMVRLAPISRLNCVVTDIAVAADDLQALRSQGVSVEAV